ncbi:uncharacterized protein LOC144821270 isoform X2 [Lissotriton helveticus]
MAVPLTLLLLTALCGPVVADRDFCVEQPESLRVRFGESVTIPCTYSYPWGLGLAKVVEVSWRLTTGDRCGQSPFIYNYTNTNLTTHIDQKYEGRLTLVGNVLDERSGAIQINNLTTSDTIGRYCCRVTILEGLREPKMWQNKHATQLVLADNPPSHVIQLDAIPARVGGSVTIPCGFTYSGKLDFSKDLKVSWNAGSGDLCLNFSNIYNQTNNYMHHDYRGRVTLVTDPRGNGTSSLHITGLTVNDSKRYCCNVMVKDKWISSSHGTELVVGDLTRIEGYKVTQPEVIEPQQDLFTVNCTFTYPQDKDPLWIGVYLVDGVEWEKIIRYPSQESINLGYKRNISELSSSISLPVNNVADIGAKSIYCLVVFRFCKENNGFTSVIQLGPGTRLVMKGLICKGSKEVKNEAVSPVEVQLNTLTEHPKNSQNPVNSDVSRVSNVQKVEDGLLYAALNLDNAKSKVSRAQPLPQEETVYSTVRMK